MRKWWVRKQQHCANLRGQIVEKTAGISYNLFLQGTTRGHCNYRHPLRERRRMSLGPCSPV